MFIPQLISVLQTMLQFLVYFLFSVTSMFLFPVKASNVLRCDSMQVFVRTFGCSSNLADGEALTGCLSQSGHKIVETISSAELVIYNTCAVKGPTENRVIEALKRVPQEKKLIVAGCLPLINFDRLHKEVRFDGAIGPSAGGKIVDVVSRVAAGEKVVALETVAKMKPNLSLPRRRSNSAISVLPVSYGCLGSCAYCCVVFARGLLRSCTVKEVTDQVQKDLASGVKEFWLTSQDMACYGRDIGENLATLVKALGKLDGDFRVRVGMMTPNLAAEILDDLVGAFKNNKIFKFLHLPVQSGDDQVLNLMRRFYTIREFKGVVRAFRQAFPDITLATDVICGFPGETKEAFERTLELIKEIKPDVINVSKFFARPRTAAADMNTSFVDPGEIKRRSKEATKAAKEISLDGNQHWIGWTGDVLIDEKGKIPGTWIGRNFAYKPITVECSNDLLGKIFRVNVVNAFSTHLTGKPEIC
jgi:threonylcarbamoyladenosine tRNA methylthiotransferase CDKAL1